MSAADSGWVTGGADSSLDDGATKGKWDQFEENKRLFGTKNTYDETLYTTALNLNDFSAEDQRRAERQAREIEGSAASGPRTTNVHLLEERGQLAGTDADGIDEESRFSGVARSPGEVARLAGSGGGVFARSTAFTSSLTARAGGVPVVSATAVDAVRAASLAQRGAIDARKNHAPLADQRQVASRETTSSSSRAVEVEKMRDFSAGLAELSAGAGGGKVASVTADRGPTGGESDGAGNAAPAAAAAGDGAAGVANTDAAKPPKKPLSMFRFNPGATEFQPSSSPSSSPTPPASFNPAAGGGGGAPINAQQHGMAVPGSMPPFMPPAWAGAVPIPFQGSMPQAFFNAGAVGGFSPQLYPGAAGYAPAGMPGTAPPFFGGLPMMHQGGGAGGAGPTVLQPSPELMQQFAINQQMFAAQQMQGGGAYGMYASMPPWQLAQMQSMAAQQHQHAAAVAANVNAQQAAAQAQAAHAHQSLQKSQSIDLAMHSAIANSAMLAARDAATPNNSSGTTNSGPPPTNSSGPPPQAQSTAPSAVSSSAASGDAPAQSHRKNSAVDAPPAAQQRTSWASKAATPPTTALAGAAPVAPMVAAAASATPGTAGGARPAAAGAREENRGYASAPQPPKAYGRK